MRYRATNTVRQVVGDELLVVTPSVNVAYCLDQRAAEVLLACETPQSIGQLCQRVVGTKKEELLKILGQLVERGLVEIQAQDEARRRFLQKVAGLAGGALIASVTVPSPAAAASGFPVTNGCDVVDFCASGAGVCPPGQAACRTVCEDTCPAGTQGASCTDLCDSLGSTLICYTCRAPGTCGGDFPAQVVVC